MPLYLIIYRENQMHKKFHRYRWDRANKEQLIIQALAPYKTERRHFCQQAAVRSQSLSLAHSL